MRGLLRLPVMFRSGRRRAGGYLLAGTALAAIACASSPPAGGGPALEEVYTNAPGCAEVAAAHRANPTMEVHVPAQMIGLAVPGEREPGAEAEVRFTVTETGEVDPESIAVEGHASPRMHRHLIDVAKRMRFRPARVGDCWVTSTYAWTYRS